MSAATSVRLFLWSVIIGAVLAIVGIGLALQWWTERQKQQRRQDTLEQAQIYALLTGPNPKPYYPPQLQTPPTSHFPQNPSGGWEVLQ